MPVAGDKPGDVDGKGLPSGVPGTLRPDAAGCRRIHVIGERPHDHRCTVLDQARQGKYMQSIFQNFDGI